MTTKPNGWHIVAMVALIVVPVTGIIFGLSYLFKSPAPLLLIVLMAWALILRDAIINRRP